MIQERSTLNRLRNFPSKFSLKNRWLSSRSHSRTSSVTRKRERKKEGKSVEKPIDRSVTISRITPYICSRG